MNNFNINSFNANVDLNTTTTTNPNLENGIQLMQHIALYTIVNLKTRMEVVGWIEKFQELSGKKDPADGPIPNSVGSGFISALNLADSGAKMLIVSNKPLEAVVSTLLRMQLENKLDVLNSTTADDFLYSQVVETEEHRKVCYGENPKVGGGEHSYCMVGKILTDMGETNRAAFCQAISSKQVAWLAKSINYLTPALNNINFPNLTDISKTLKALSYYGQQT